MSDIKDIEARMLELAGKPETPAVSFEELSFLLEKYVTGADEAMGDEENPRRYVRVPLETWLALIGNFITAALAEAIARQRGTVVAPGSNQQN